MTIYTLTWRPEMSFCEDTTLSLCQLALSQRPIIMIVVQITFTMKATNGSKQLLTMTEILLSLSAETDDRRVLFHCRQNVIHSLSTSETGVLAATETGGCKWCSYKLYLRWWLFFTWKKIKPICVYSFIYFKYLAESLDTVSITKTYGAKIV